MTGRVHPGSKDGYGRLLALGDVFGVTPGRVAIGGYPVAEGAAASGVAKPAVLYISGFVGGSCHKVGIGANGAEAVVRTRMAG